MDDAADVVPRDDHVAAAQVGSLPVAHEVALAVEHPWVFREIHARLRGTPDVGGPTIDERLGLCAAHLTANTALRGEPYGVRCTRRHLTGYLKGLHGASALRQELFHEDTLAGSLAILERARTRLENVAPAPKAA